MSEAGEVIEQKPITRGEVIEAFQGVTGKEFMDPENLPTYNNPKFNAAREMLRAWINEQDEQAKNATPEEIAEIELSKATVLIDAGFRNKRYLSQVREWLEKDIASAENEDVSPQTVAKIQSRIDEIDTVLKSSQPQQQAA